MTNEEINQRIQQLLNELAAYGYTEIRHEDSEWLQKVLEERRAPEPKCEHGKCITGNADCAIGTTTTCAKCGEPICAGCGRIRRREPKAPLPKGAKVRWLKRLQGYSLDLWHIETVDLPHPLRYRIRHVSGALVDVDPEDIEIDDAPAPKVYTHGLKLMPADIADIAGIPGPKDPRPPGCRCGDNRNPRCPVHGSAQNRTEKP